MPFYRFLGVHSFLIGLLPFYLPVWLTDNGYSLSELSLFIAMSGLSFCLCLGLWERAALVLSVHQLVVVSLWLEIALLALLPVLHGQTPWLMLLATVNGLYTCFFWTTQRVMFLSMTSGSATGRHYGNFQIFVSVFLKLGMLAGALLLQRDSLLWLILLSVLVVVAGSIYFFGPGACHKPVARVAPVTLREKLRFNDELGSRSMFVTDGLFLFLESHFWVYTLFRISGQDFTRLGLLVITLAVLFAVLFVLLKNSIDKLTDGRAAGRWLWLTAVGLYAISWLLRSGVEQVGNHTHLALLLLVITFCTSYFRLLLNQRFFSNAATGNARHYLIIKSIYTQFFVGVFFLAISVFLAVSVEPDDAVNRLYLIAAPLGLLYIRYKKRETGIASTTPSAL